MLVSLAAMGAVAAEHRQVGAVLIVLHLAPPGGRLRRVRAGAGRRAGRALAEVVQRDAPRIAALLAAVSVRIPRREAQRQRRVRL